MWPEGRSGLEVKVEGFSHKLPLLTRTILQRLAAFEVALPCILPETHEGEDFRFCVTLTSPYWLVADCGGWLQVPKEHFGHVKEALVRKYGNANLNVDRHATYLRLRSLKHVWDVEDVRIALEKLQPSDVQARLRTPKFD